MIRRRLLKKTACLITALTVGAASFMPCFDALVKPLPFTNDTAYAASQDKTMTLATCRSLALEKSAEYEKAQMNVDSKQAARESAVKALKLKKKNLTTFRWKPLLKFHFPEKLNFTQESEFNFKPVKLQNEVTVAQHKMQDTIFTVNESVNNLYTQIVTLQDTIEFNEKRLASLQDGLARNQAKLKKGDASQSDVDRLQKKVTTLESTIAGDRRNLESNLSKLSKMIGLDVSTGYKFEKPYVEAKIERDSLPAIIQYAEDRDETYYEACMSATIARIELRTNYGLYKSHYGKDCNLISSYINQVLNDQEISAKAFKNDYKKFLDKIDSYWKGKFRILFIKISKEFRKGDLDGTRYIEEDPYTVYQNAIDYASAHKDELAARDALEQSVTDSFNNYVSIRNSYENYLKEVDEQKVLLDKYAVKNRLGEMTFEEYSDEQDAYEELQNNMLQTMSLYTTTLYSFDRLTCGGVSALLSGTDADLKTAVVGESFTEKSTSEATYYLKPIIQRELFELSVYFPDEFPVEITDFELWCDNEQIGERTPKDGKLRHLMLSKQKVEEVKIRFYNGDEFVDDCVIDPDEESGVLSIVTAIDINKLESGEVGTYETNVSEVTGLYSITMKPVESENIAFYRLLSEDGTPLASKDMVKIDQKFTYLGLLSTDMDKLKIEFYDNSQALLYKGYFDTTNKKLKKDTEESANE